MPTQSKRLIDLCLDFQFETILSVSLTKPSPVQSLSDCRPFLTAFLCSIASRCLRTKSVWVVKYGRDALFHPELINATYPRGTEVVFYKELLTKFKLQTYPLKSSMDEKLWSFMKSLSSAQSFFTRPYPCIITPVHTWRWMWFCHVRVWLNELAGLHK